MGAPLLERIDSMPESPTGTNGMEHSAVFVISDEEEVHGARNFHTPTQTGPQKSKSNENEGESRYAVWCVMYRRKKLRGGIEGKKGANQKS